MIVIVASLFFAGCSADIPEEIQGTWRVNSPFYKSTCAIVVEDGRALAKVLTYDDGTTKYSFSEDRPWYVFENLRSKGDTYVDGVSGATSKEVANVAVVQSDVDTLQITTYVMDRPLTEIWTRL